MKHWFTAGLLSASIAASMTAQAQEEIQHQGLFADWYAGDSATAVIVLHGTLAHKRMEIIETFASLLNEDYDFPVLAPNLALNQPDRPGMIDCAIPHDHTHMEAVDELTQWVSWLEGQGYEQIAIMGHSRGGAQVAAYLQNASDSIMAAGLVAPATYDAEKSAKGYLEATGQSLNTLLEKAQGMAAGAQMNVPRFVYCDDATVTAQAFLGYHSPNKDFDTPTLLTQVSVPVQVFIGSEDKVVEGLDEKLEAIQPGGELASVTIDGADHFFRDLYADDVIAEFAEFLDR